MVHIRQAPLNGATTSQRVGGILIFAMSRVWAETQDAHASYDDTMAMARIEEKVQAYKEELAQKREERQQERQARRAKYNPDMMANCDFAKPECWKDFYQSHTETFDWYRTPVEVLQPSLRSLGEPARVLHVGCGSSSWVKSLADFPEVHSVLNVDINSEVIDRMEQEHADDARVSFKVMDAAKLDVNNCSFDAVVDKGLLDVFRSQGSAKVDSIFAELRRVIKARGLLLFVSYSGPDRQSEAMRRACTVDGIEGSDQYLYVCKGICTERVVDAEL
mmetsp:Transcript_27651/g.54250  ORF Transcript_27651/g.54250 Transcript_27651/m.54250 type:complete len:276 (+) Transcript_27651:45-872(+)